MSLRYLGNESNELGPNTVIEFSWYCWGFVCWIFYNTLCFMQWVVSGFNCKVIIGINNNNNKNTTNTNNNNKNPTTSKTTTTTNNNNLPELPPYFKNGYSC